MHIRIVFIFITTAYLASSCSLEEFGQSPCNEIMDDDIRIFGDEYTTDEILNDRDKTYIRYWWSLGQGSQYEWNYSRDTCSLSRFQFSPVELTVNED